MKPSYGLTDEQVERMLEDALDFGEADLEARRLVEARIEGERILLSTRKALATDAALLEASERDAIEAAVRELEEAIAKAARAASIELRVKRLAEATHAFAGRRMDRAIREAIGGKSLGDVEKTVEHAAGIEAHLAEKGIS